MRNVIYNILFSLLVNFFFFTIMTQTFATSEASLVVIYNFEGHRTNLALA